MVVLGRRGGTLLGQVFNLISFIVRRLRASKFSKKYCCFDGAQHMSLRLKKFLETWADTVTQQNLGGSKTKLGPRLQAKLAPGLPVRRAAAIVTRDAGRRHFSQKTPQSPTISFLERNFLPNAELAKVATLASGEGFLP